MKGHMKERNPGSWSIWIELGKDENGKRRQKCVTFRGTKRDAQRELNRLLAELQAGGYVEPSKMTVGQFLQRWLEDYAKSNVGTKTYCTYAEFIRIHLSPALGHHPLAKLQPLHIQAYYTKALESGRKDGKGGLSAQSVLHHHRLLRAALQQAVKWQMLARNPADFVDPPRVARAEMQAVDERGAVGFLKAAEGTTVYLPMLVAVTTGMRRGEVLGLRWEDVDLKAGTLTVRQALGQSRAGLEFKQPKTTKSRRVIELPALLVEALVRHKGEQAKEKLLMGAAYQSLGLLFAHPDGRPIQPDHLSKLFAKLAKQAGSPLRFNGLRHSHASQLLKQGESVKVVSERLGHADASTTLRVYSHVLPGMGRAAASRMDAALREAMGEDEGGAVSESA